MFMYEFFIENKEWLKIVYSLLITIICAIIVIKTDKLHKLSLHQGIRYFRNAFFFYGIAFIIRYIGGAFFTYVHLSNYSILINIFFEYFVIMAGFFLLYSLLWKKVETSSIHSRSSLFNLKIALFYLMTFIIVSLDFIWKAYYFMFASQILLFAFAVGISYSNYKNNGKKHSFLKFYFIAMVLSLIAWILNSLIALSLDWNQGILMNIYGINIIIFVLFLYGVVKITNINNRKK